MTISFTLSQITAVTGAVLGIYNTFTAWRKDRVRLKVVPSVYIFGHGGILRSVHGNDLDLLTCNLCIEVINLGALDCVVAKVGLQMEDGSEYVLIKSAIPEFQGTPQKIAPRESYVFYSTDLDYRRLPKLKAVFASTVCGKKFTGTSGIITKLRALKK